MHPAAGVGEPCTTGHPGDPAGSLLLQRGERRGNRDPLLGYVDDARFARQFAEDRRNLDSWGSKRIERRLRELGVGREHIAAGLAALAAGEGPSEVEVAVELLRRRFPAPPQTDRDRERALGLLVRRGYDLELAYDAIRAHGRTAA